MPIRSIRILVQSVLVFVLCLFVMLDAEDAKASPAPLTDYIQAQTEDLRTALNLAPAAISGVTSDADLFRYAEALWAWKMLGPRNPLPGTADQYRLAGYKSNAMFRELLRRDPGNLDLYWRIGRNNYDIGELTDENDKKTRGALYEEIITLAEECIQKDPNEMGCIFYKAVGLGRKSTQRGVLASLFIADDIQDALIKAEGLKDSYILPPGDEPMIVDVYFMASIAYRLVPDSWLIKVISGVRGDKEKALAYIRKAVAFMPYRIELEKELAVALLCLGVDDDQPKLIKEGKQVIGKILDGTFDKYDIRATDDIDKRHAAELLAKPEIACGYSRDGYQDVSDDAVNKVKK